MVLMPYSCTVVLNDQAAPDIEQVSWANDGTFFTSVTIYFSESVKSGTLMIDNVPVGSAAGETTTISGLHLDGFSSHQISVDNISDGVNTEKSSVITGVARLYDPPKTDTAAPAIEQDDYTRDASGRVNSIIITYNEDLQPWIPTGHITAFDSNGNTVYAEQTVTDSNGSPVGTIKTFCNSTTLPEDPRRAVFNIAEGVDIYSSEYQVVLSADLVVDLQYNGSFEATITIGF